MTDSILAERGVKVCNVPDYGTTEVADHAIALALTLRRGILLHHDLQRANPPAEWNIPNSPLVQRPQTRTFGILGLGRIGTAVSLRAKAFGWRVLFYDPFLPSGYERALGIERAPNIEDLFRQSDTLSIHTPLTTQTRGLVSHGLLRLMPMHSCVINTARGPIVDLDALYSVLHDGHLSGAALNVLPDEPINEANVPKLIRASRQRGLVDRKIRGHAARRISFA